ncbi:MAG: DMT family transporter, partial [Proteobacteria bacterium]|nr:DMT family transporter [Pseudomonadota bacterium]
MATGRGDVPGLSFGVGLVVFAALTLATKGIAIKFLHADQVDVITMLFVRNMAATPFFWAFAVWRIGAAEILNVRPGSVLAAAAAGVFCYYFGGLAEFASLEFVDASVQRLLIFTFPAMVVLLEAMRRSAMPPRRQIIALGLTSMGLFLVLGGVDSKLEGSLDRWGVVLALFAAFTVAVYLLVNQSVARLMGSIRFLIYAQTGALSAMACHFAVTVEEVDLALPVRAWWVLGYLSVFVAVLTWLAMAEGVRIIGASRAALVSTIGPPATLLLAYLMLGEVMTPVQLAGAAVIIL